MSLPLSIDNVPYYRIAGQYCFQGDLIFIAGSIYFFPHTDLDQRRTEIREALDVPVLGLVFETILRPVVFPLLLAIAIRGSNNSRLRGRGVWREGDSSEALKVKLDGLVAELKRSYRQSASLPVPSCFRRHEVSNLKLSATGALSFDAQSDRHDFS